MSEIKKILICLPVYNEELLLEKNTLKILNFCQREMQGYDWQIVIAENSSTDKTLEIAKNLSERFTKIKYFHNAVIGKGRVIKTAWQKYEADIYCFMDIDLSTDLSYFPLLISIIDKKEADLAIGSRLSAESKTKRPVLRELISRTYNLLLKLFFHLQIKDYHCGFKAASKDLVKKIIPQIKDNQWFFDTELIILSHRNGYKIKEIPVQWEELPGRKTRVKIIKTSWEYLKGIVRLKLMD